MSRRCTSCGVDFIAAKRYHRLCWTCWHGDQERRPPAARPLLDARTLREAIGLTHPDVHPAERRERATAVTAKLTVALEQARQLERAA